MLKLITFPPSLGVRAPSPFALKADALLAMSGLPYEREYGDLRKAPRGKFPVLNDNGTLIPDTVHIQTYLEQKKDIDFDSHLSEEERAMAVAFRRLIEHHLYFINGHFRWMEHPHAVRDNYFAAVPGPIRGLVFRMVQKQVAKTMHLQGLGRHTRNELIAFAGQDIKALAVQLDYKPFFLGDQPSSIDASLYGALENMINCELDTPMKAECAKHENLVDYCARFREAVFND